MEIINEGGIPRDVIVKHLGGCLVTMSDGQVRSKSRRSFGDTDCLTGDLLVSGQVLVGDTKDVDTSLHFLPDNWQDFVDGVRQGDFDH